MTIKARYGWFAAGHVCVSLLGAGSMFLAWVTICRVDGVPGQPPLALAATLFCALLMLAYVPAGLYTARRRAWSRPGTKLAVLSVLLPALTAWAWEGIAVACLYNEATAWVAFVLIIAATVFAAPSFCFMFFAVLLAFLGDESIPLLLFFMFLAGLLPPLLFYLGTLLHGAPQ